MGTGLWIRPSELLKNGIEILYVHRSNATRWHAVIKHDNKIEMHMIDGNCKNDADAWLAARKQFAAGGRR